MLISKGRISMGYDGTLKFDTEILEKGFSVGIKKLGSIAKGGLALTGAAIAGVTAAFGAMTKASLDSVASLEQNLGGVETLFKENAQAVIDNANKAYKTAGMSANAYMQSVTSFAASLLQSVAGNTEEAARIADMAMVDMSDNANKMGTSMELIQNAYQGFAKQNYTMLDNLKLGYGGTKEEMQRLLKDAEKLSGVKYDISNLSDVYNAIHVIQGELGITGTTAKEAATTIQGSMDSAKAAFDNFLNGSGSPAELAEAMVTAGKNIVSAMAEIVPRLAQTIPELKRLVVDGLRDAFSGDSLQSLIDAGRNMVTNVLSGFRESIPKFLSIAGGLTTAFIETAKNTVPQLLQTGYEIISNIISGIVEAIPEALPKILDFVQGIGEKLAEAAPIMIQKGFELLGKLVEGIVTAFPILVSRVPEIISTFANIINDNFPTILMKGAELLGQLIMGLMQAIPTLIANIPQIISAIVDTIMAFQWLNLGKNIIKFFGDGIGAMKDFVLQKGKSILDGIKNAFLKLPSTLMNIGKSAIQGLGNAISSAIGFVKTAASNIVQAVVSTISSIPGKMLSIGKNIVKGLWNGISNMTGWIADKVMGFANSVLGGIKKALGIHSPSKRMRDEVGKYMAIGMGVGFEKNIPVKKMESGVNEAIERIQVAAGTVRNETIITKPTEIATGSRREDTEMKSAILKLAKLAQRPIEVTTMIDKTKMARTMAIPVQDELAKGKTIKKMLEGDK